MVTFVIVFNRTERGSAGLILVKGSSANLYPALPRSVLLIPRKARNPSISASICSRLLTSVTQTRKSFGRSDMNRDNAMPPSISFFFPEARKQLHRLHWTTHDEFVETRAGEGK